ncbi:MAG: hypothetical protein C4527_14170 [Candidatus Omnitrophota bacterium]|nr:MAG: hypothetical protein C4527_14170 [Candidatus Omnitrophota bacterium]
MKPAGYSASQWLIGVILTIAIICSILAIVLPVFLKEKKTGSGLQSDIERLRRTDPLLIRYDELKPSIKTDLKWARNIAVSSDDRVIVTGGRAMRVYDSAGQKLALEIETEQEISAIAVADDGSLYLGVGDHIKMFDSSGRLLNRWESVGPKAVLTSIGISNDDVFVADAGNRTIHRYNISGEKRASFGDFIIPSFYFDLAISADGLLYAANTGEHRIETYDLDGNLISWWGVFSNEDPKGFCGCCNPVNFALLPNEEGFITCEKGIARVKIYDKEGNFEGFVAGAEQFKQYDSIYGIPEDRYNPVGLDVAVDSKGRVMVLDPATAEVRIFQRKTDDL